MPVHGGEHWITTDSGVIYARAWAPLESPSDERAAILLFHDSLGCVDLWRDFPEQLAMATGRGVVAYDRLGFGRSAARVDQLPLTFIHDEAVKAVPRLLEALDLEAIVPFGHSVGGAMAIVTAAHWPERVVAVVTESAQSFVEARTREGLLAARADFERPGQLERLARYHGVKARWVLDSWIETWLNPEFAAWTLDNHLRNVRCSALALHGDRDEFGSRRHPERIARLVAGQSRVVILDGCGHVPHREQPAAVLDEVARFLKTDGAHCSRNGV